MFDETSSLTPQQRGAITRAANNGGVHPGGGPTKYDPAYCEKVIEWGAQGWSLAEMAAEMDVSKPTVYAWKEAHPEFLAAMTRAEAKCQAWWEKAGRDGMISDKFNGTVWAKNMNCRFKDDWRDTIRQEQTGPDGGPIKVESSDAIAELTRRLTRLAAGNGPQGDAGGSQP